MRAPEVDTSAESYAENIRRRPVDEVEIVVVLRSRYTLQASAVRSLAPSVQRKALTASSGASSTLNGTLLSCLGAFLGLRRSFWLSYLTGLTLYRSCVGLSSPVAPPTTRSLSPMAALFLDGDEKEKRAFDEGVEGEVARELVELEVVPCWRGEAWMEDGSTLSGPKSSVLRRALKVLFASSVEEGKGVQFSARSGLCEARRMDGPFCASVSGACAFRLPLVGVEGPSGRSW